MTRSPLYEFYRESRREALDIWEHLPRFVWAVRTLNAQQVVEVGVGTANSSSAWLMGLRRTGGRLWSVDIEPTKRAEELRRIVPEWEYVIADSLSVEPPECDVLFIDSSHTFTQTYAELCAYVPKVRPGGVVFLHDTGPHQPGVKDALDLFGMPWSDIASCYGLGTILV